MHYSNSLFTQPQCTRTNHGLVSNTGLKPEYERSTNCFHLGACLEPAIRRYAEFAIMPCRATKHQSNSLGMNLKSLRGKRLDLQCRAGEMELELNNSEFKRCFSTPSKLNQQYSKNVLINHSMILHLKEMINFLVDVLDM
ncbi:hypothetical protein BGZ65_006710, partial [Modicella reniformis]